MELVTSYFGRQKELRKAGYKIVSVSRFNPRYCHIDVDLKIFAPRPDMINMEKGKYNVEFQKILQKIDIDFVRSYLRDLEKRGYVKLALCCYEVDVNTCHRKQVGEYLAIKLMQEIQEFRPEPASKNPEVRQNDLFK